MRKVLFVLMFALMAMVAMAQGAARLKANYLTIRYDEGWGFTEWSDWQRVDITISLDFDNSRLVIYSKKRQDYVLTSYRDDDYDYESGYITCDAVDDEGKRCKVDFFYPKDGYERSVKRAIYVRYSDFEWGYIISNY